MAMRPVLFLLPVLASAAAPAAAQDAPPSVRDFKLEPAPKPAVDPRLQGPGLTPKPAPLPTERPPAAPPPQRPTASDQAAPSAAAPPPAPPARSAPSPASRDTIPRTGPRAGRDSAPAAERPVPPSRSERTNAVPAPAPAPEPSEPSAQALPSSATATPPPRAEPLPDGETSRGPLALFALAGLLGLGALLLVARRRRPARRASARVAEPEAAVPARPEPPVPPPAAIPAAPAAPLTPLVLVFEPLEARATALGSSLKCRLTVTNAGPAPATDLSLDLTMAGAGPEGDAQLRHFAVEGSGRPRLDLPDLPPGESRTIERSLRVGARDFRPIQLADRAIFVPLVGVDLAGTVAGGTVRVTGAHVVGRAPKQGTKMGPFRVDQGPRHYRELGQRPHALAG